MDEPSKPPETATAKPKRKPPAGWKPPAKDPVTGKFLRRDGSPGKPKPAAAVTVQATGKGDDGWKLLLVVAGLLFLAWALGGARKGKGGAGATDGRAAA
jgi:hypothetical protein